jgi:hypothetical protein
MRGLVVRIALRFSVFIPVLTTAQQISGPAYEEVRNRVSANQAAFFVYHDADSGFNHGFPSGFFGTTSAISVNAACVYDASSSTGCSSSSTVLDQQRGTVFQISFAPLSTTEYAGVNFDEPATYANTGTGTGYNLTGSTTVSFDICSPTPGMNVQIGVGQHVTQYFTVPQSWTTMTVPLSSLGLSASDLQNVNVLFGVATNGNYLPANGGTVLLDNI